MSAGYQTVDVAAAEVLPGTRSFGKVAEALLGDGRALWAVQGPDGALGGLSDLAVREAIQRQAAADTTLWQLADPGLVSESVEAAVVALGARGVAARLVERPDGLAVVERVSPAARDAVVMAGGFGTRLRPLTDDTPKPLLEVGERPLLCRILAQLKAVGVQRVHVSVHYLAERVRELVGDGSAFGLEALYLEEELPLGTGAGLSLMQRVDGPFLREDVALSANLNGYETTDGAALLKAGE